MLLLDETCLCFVVVDKGFGWERFLYVYIIYICFVFSFFFLVGVEGVRSGEFPRAL